VPTPGTWPAQGQVERVHAEHGDCARTDSGERVVLKNNTTQLASERAKNNVLVGRLRMMQRTVVCVVQGVVKKLRCEKGWTWAAMILVFFMVSYHWHHWRCRRVQRAPLQPESACETRTSVRRDRE
jgi:hypothetical protein